MVSYAKEDRTPSEGFADMEPCEEGEDWSMSRWSYLHLQNILEDNGTLGPSDKDVREHLLLRHLLYHIDTLPASTSDVLKALCRAVRRSEASLLAIGHSLGIRATHPSHLEDWVGPAFGDWFCGVEGPLYAAWKERYNYVECSCCGVRFDGDYSLGTDACQICPDCADSGRYHWCEEDCHGILKPHSRSSTGMPGIWNIWLQCAECDTQYTINSITKA